MKFVIKAASQGVLFLFVSLVLWCVVAYLLWTLWTSVSEAVSDIGSEDGLPLVRLVGTILLGLVVIVATWICGFLGLVSFRIGWFTLDEVPNQVSKWRANS